MSSAENDDNSIESFLKWLQRRRMTTERSGRGLKDTARTSLNPKLNSQQTYGLQTRYKYGISVPVLLLLLGITCEFFFAPGDSFIGGPFDNKHSANLANYLVMRIFNGPESSRVMRTNATCDFPTVFSARTRQRRKGGSRRHDIGDSANR